MSEVACKSAVETQSLKAVLFDLDGLLLDTESLCVEVAEQVLAKHGKVLTKDAHTAALGKRPLDCWRDVAAILELDVPAEQLFNETEPLLQARWHETKPLPGALRILAFFQQQGLPIALATSTSRATFTKKMVGNAGLPDFFQAIVCGDEVPAGKPAPDVFLAAAEALGVEPKDCLVFEDAPSGVEAATAAGMRVIMVPSLVFGGQAGQEHQPQADPGSSPGLIQVLPSLLAFDPSTVGLPHFADLVEGVIPMGPVLYIKGPVVKGFGRGSAELGIPTANVDTTCLRSCLAEAVTGIYCGWASVGDSSEVYPMCMSIGWNPFYGNKDKTAEPWILHTFDKPFYGAEIRLVVCGYVRPEANFTTLEALTARIHKDGDVSKAALEQAPLKHFAADKFLQPALASSLN